MRRGSLRTIRAAAVGIVLVAAALTPGLVGAHTEAIAVDPVADLSPDGTTIVVTGTVTCTGGEKGQVGARIAQGDSLAEGANNTRPCTGASQSFTIRAFLISGPPFSSAGADACVRSRTANDTGMHGTTTGPCPLAIVLD